MCISLEEPLLLTTKINVLDIALNFLRSYTAYALERCSGLTIQSSRNIFQVIKAVTYAFKEMINKMKMENALTYCQDRHVFPLLKKWKVLQIVFYLYALPE